MTEQLEKILPSSVTGNEELDTSNMSLESLILLINAERLRYLQETTTQKFQDLREKQKKVADIHNIMKAINSATTENGELHIKDNAALQDLLKTASDLGIEIKADKHSYNAIERDHLMENFRMSVEDLNVDNELMIQEISRLTNERYESYQLAKTCLKPLQDAKHSYARAMRGQ